MMAVSRDSMERTVMTVPAELRQVRVVRLVVAGTLSLHPIGSSLVDDLCSAVDEACTLVLGQQDTPGRLTLTLKCHPDRIEADISGTFDGGPIRPDEIVRDAEAMLRIFVDRSEIDLDHHRVRFTRALGADSS